MTSPSPTRIHTTAISARCTATPLPRSCGAGSGWLATPWRSSLSLVVLITMSFSLSSLAAMLDYDEYLQRAAAATQRGDWQSVASQLAQAINHPDLPGDTAHRSAVYLAYGQAVGVLCQFEESEKYLRQAKDMAQSGSRPRANALLELGTLSIARQDRAAAIGYFQQVLAAEGTADANSRTAILEQARRGLAAATAIAVPPAKGALPHEQSGRLQKREPVGAGNAVAPYGTRCPGS